MIAFETAAAELRRQEFDRLASAMVPTLEGLRLFNARELRARIAMMLERLDYELLTSETAADLLAIKDGKKYVIAVASTTHQSATRPNELTRLHAAVINANAAGGADRLPTGDADRHRERSGRGRGPAAIANR